jgi:hypothetical protein
MNPTQFSYFIYKATSHVDTGWSRKYVSDSIVNIDIVQALCALNERGSKYVESENALYVDKAYRMVNPKDGLITHDDVEVACITTKTGCFLMRQHGVTTITGNCPGEYIFSRAQQLCDEVNAKLGTTPSKPDEPDTPGSKTDIFVGALVSIASDAVWYDNPPIPDWVKSQRWYVQSFYGDRVVIDKNESNNASINSAINKKYLTVVQNGAAPQEVSKQPQIYMLDKGTPIYDRFGKVISHIAVRTGYTIISEIVLNGKTYGKLKSGAGYVMLSDTPIIHDNTIKVGDMVKPITNKTYDGGTFVIYEKAYRVLRINGDRVVISSDGKNVTAAVKATNLQKI